MRYRFDFKQRLLLMSFLAFSILFAIGLANAQKTLPTPTPSSAGDSPGILSNSANALTGAVVGNINGIKISIPNYYLLSGVQYGGEDPLKTTPRNFIPTYDSKIEDFAIVLRLSNLQPRKTEQDRIDFNQSMHTAKNYFYETWATIGFSPKTYWTGGQVKNTVEYWEKNELHWGPFVKQKDRLAGLVQENTMQSSLSDFAHPNMDFYYDDKTFNTFIRCQNIKMVVSPYDIFTDCHHLFIIPEIKVGVEAIYTKKDLPRWREIEAESRKIIHSFIVP